MMRDIHFRALQRSTMSVLGTSKMK